MPNFYRLIERAARKAQSLPRLVYFLVAASLLVKLAFLFFSGAASDLITDDDNEAALNWLQGKGLFWQCYGGPLYSAKAPGTALFFGAWYKVFGYHVLPLVILQTLIGSLSVITVYLIARRVFNDATARVAAVLFAFYPVAIAYSTVRLADLNFYGPLFLLTVLVLLRLQEKIAWRRIVTAGLVCGVTVLFRASISLFLLIAVGWFLVTVKAALRQKLRAILGVMLIAALVMAPWWARNYVVFGRPVLAQTDRWQTAWYGNLPGSSGSLFAAPGVTLDERYAGELPPDFSKMNELEQGAVFRRLTIGYFKQDPAGFIARIFKKAYYFWYFSPYQGQAWPTAWMFWYKIYYLCIFFPALFGAWYGLKHHDRRSLKVLLLLFLLSFTVIHALCFVEGRHRFSVEPFVLMFTAYSVYLCRATPGGVRGRPCCEKPAPPA